MRVFLGNAPWRENDRIGVRAGSRWPFTMPADKNKKIPGYLPFPFFLSYATSLLKKDGIKVLLVDGIAEGDTTETFIQKIEKFEPDLVLLETSTPSIHIDLDVAKKIKERTRAKIAFSGPHASIMYKDLMDKYDFIDFILVGEYEYTILELTKYLEKNKNLKNVKGIVYKQNKKMIFTGRRPIIKNIDTLPWPARKFLPMYNYSDSFSDIPSPNVQMWASRGCPFNCIYCLWPRIMYNCDPTQYRVRNVKDVVDEMEWLTKKYNFKSVYFDDDTFNIGKDRIISLCKEIKKRGMRISWSIMARADTMDKDMLKAMKEAGLYSLKYGVESGVQQLVNNAHKNLDLKKVEEVVKKTKEMGIKVHLTFTFGLPGETWETVKKTIAFAIHLDPDTTQFSIATPFPGTEYFNWAEKNGYLLTKDWKKYDGALSAVARTEKMSIEELERACEYAQKTWSNYRMKRNFKKNPFKYVIKGIKNPKEVINILKHHPLISFSPNIFS
jgi:radical SAM superfamily enzyme YgiQ (UPF0313 family)